MKKAARIITLLLAATIASSLIGCTGTGAGEDKTSPSQTAVGTTEQAESTGTTAVSEIVLPRI